MKKRQLYLARFTFLPTWICRQKWIGFGVGIQEKKTVIILRSPWVQARVQGVLEGKAKTETALCSKFLVF